MKTSKLILAFTLFIYTHSGFALLAMNTSGHTIFKLQAALLEHHNDNTIFTIRDSNINQNIHPPIGPAIRVNHNYSLSGEAAFGYLFPSRTDIRFLIFLHDHGKKTAVMANSKLGERLDLTRAPAHWIDANSAMGASTFHQYKVHNYDIIIGHYFNYFQQLELHPYFGLTIADINNTLHTNYTEITPDQSNAFIVEKSSVTSYGTLVGLQFSYKIYSALFLQGKTEIAIMRARIRSSYSADNPDGSNNQAFVKSKLPLSNIERIGMQCGLGYQLTFNEKISALRITVGYQLAEYFNAMQTHFLSENDQSALSLHLLENIGFSGPYLSVLITI